jgi:predicted nucleic acid-binding protein
MIGLDCNILVQLALAEHPRHTATRRIVDYETDRSESLVFPTSVLTEYLHVVTDNRRFTPPLTMSEALNSVEELLANPSVTVLESSLASARLTLSWVRQYRLGRKRILDTHLAAILHLNGVRRLLTSNPADFTIFGVFELLTP